MTTQLELTKRELDLLLRGLRDVLIDENERSHRPGGRGYVPTKNYIAAEALEAKLIAAFNAACTEAK